MDQFGGLECELVPEVVPSDFVRGGASDVAGLSLPRCSTAITCRQAEEAVDWAHPSGVASCQAVVGGHHVDPLVLLGVPDNPGSGRQRLTFAGLHFRFDGDIFECVFGLLPAAFNALSVNLDSSARRELIRRSRNKRCIAFSFYWG